jgi:hypothetical protein
VSIALPLAAVTLAAGSCRSVDYDLHGSLGEGRYRRYVPPLANPLFNETPYITTEARPLYLRQNIPDDLVAGGPDGEIDLGALELRLALTERFGLIASKDGYADIDFERVLNDAEGFANFSIGFKYALVDRPQDETIVSFGVEYEPTSGKIETEPTPAVAALLGGQPKIRLQGGGDGLIDVFLTGATVVNDAWGLQGNVGINTAIDSNEDASFLHYSAHVDYSLTERLFPIVELDGFTIVREPDRFEDTVLDGLVDFDGVDLVSIGTGDKGTVFTGTLGFRYRLNRNVIFGAGYQRPLTEREDILEERYYVDAVISY